MKRTITFLMLLLMAGAAMAQGEFVCGDTVRDGNGNAYATVQIGALCWTKSNMRAVSYADGTPIAKAMIYNSERYNDTVANLANFGRLYTWFSAVNVPEGDDVKPAKDTAGFVQGVCPEGWHIPTVGEMNDLRSVPEEDLHSTDFWVLPNANTNSTGFSEVPGGKFSAELDRFEGLYTNSYMWTDSATSSEWVVACNSRYFCDKASEESIRKHDALSVRCVRVAEVCSEVATFNVDECDVTDTSALVKGNAKVEKGTFTEYGFVWGVSEDALTTTVSGSVVSAMTSDGDFEAAIKGLPACGDTVWYAAYAKSSQCKDLIYGDTMMFVVCGKAKDAQPCPFAPKIFDNEGNEYNTVQIGNQCWMKENLRTKHWNDGTEIPLVDVRDDDLREPMMYQNPYNQELYYNWPAANNEKGICPEGWHIPSDVEFYELFDYVGSKSDYVCGTKTHDSYENISKALASTEGWNHSDSTCTPGNQPQNNNATGFSALPTGTPPVNSPFTDWSVGNYAAGYWSSIELTGSGTTEYYKNVSYYYLTMDHDEAHPRGWVAMKRVRASVRCLKDACGYVKDDCPIVITDTSFLRISSCDTSVVVNAELNNMHGVQTDWGFVWGKDKNSLTDTVNFANGDDVTSLDDQGRFEYGIKNIKRTDTIWYVAFAKSNKCDKVIYGDTLYWYLKDKVEDGKPCFGVPTVKDFNGYVYNTVQIGNQCWMKENLRSTKYADGTNIPLADRDTSTTKAYRYNPNNDGGNVKEYGYLYNWAAVMHGEGSSNSNPSKVQGICPDGWHVPSESEFRQLFEYVGSKSDYLCNGKADSIAKALCYPEGWDNSSTDCAVGNAPENNNLTGFSAKPAGTFGDGNSPGPGYWFLGRNAMFWTSTGVDTLSPDWQLDDISILSVWPPVAHRWGYGSKNISINAGSVKPSVLNSWKFYARSVRCVMDACDNTLPSTDNCPTVTTTAATNVASDSAKINGVVTNVSGTVENYGFVWGTNKNTVSTTMNGTSVTAMTADGDFSSILKGLNPCDTIWYAAFTKTSECDDYVYGDTLMFVTPAAAPDYTTCGTLTDVDDNVYTTVKIGEQCWMAENLRVTKYADGTPLTDRTANSTENIGFTTRAYFAPNGDAANVNKYGLLYSWAAATNATNTTSSGSYQTWENYEGQGICPAGWHVPSDAEWTTLTNYVRDNLTGCLCDNTAVGKALASATDWKSGGEPADADFFTRLAYTANWGECSIGWPATLGQNNITGFNAYPAGNWNYESGKSGFFKFGEETMFWTSTLYGTTHNTYGYNNALKRTMYYYRKDVESGNYYQLNTARSVRCLKDAETQANCPTVTTGAAAATADGDVTVGGQVSNLTGTVEANGFAYGESKADLASTVANASGSNESLSATIAGAAPCDTIWYAAFTKTSECDDYVYGDTLMFVIPAAAPDYTSCGTLTDVDDNVYTTVKIGGQCWMAENLRVTKYADGTPLTDRTANSTENIGFTTRAYFAPNGDAANVAKYGLLYSWAAATNATNTTTSGTFQTWENYEGQGICPDGWHLPSDAEWDTLTNYVRNNYTTCLCDNTSIGKALASATDWKSGGAPTDASWSQQLSYNSNWGECSIGWPATLGQNNITGFNAYPAGNWNYEASSDGFFKFGEEAMFWTSTLYGTTHNTYGYNNALKRTMYYYRKDVESNNYYQLNTARSVRCLKDSDTCNVSDGSPCPNAKTVTDIDGITYNTVKIGEQCWMKENMRAKHFADGQEIEIASSDDDSRPTCWFPNGDENNVEAYGLLYNRIAAMNGISASYANPSGIQGVCPDGWHVPSYTEWYQLYNYVGSIPSALCSADTSKYIGKSLASKTGWLTVDEGVCNVGFNADGNNFTGFSAMPAGEQLSSASNFRYYSFGKESEIWSTTRELDYIGRGYYAGLVNNRPDDIMWRSIIGNQGLSVRCLKDDGCDCNTQTELPTVITSSHVSNINIVAADGGGFVSSQGSSSVTERGVCWSTSHNPTVTDNRTTDGNGAGRFTSYINNLTQGTTYYIRAYATNSSGTAYGREVEYTVPSVSSADGKPCPGTPIVFDHEGNKYNTVQIGTQCWTKENLRTTTSPSTGTYIVAKTGSILTTAGKMARWYNNDSVTYAPKNYGLLYNYNAAVDTFDVQFDETSTDTTMYKNIQFPKNSIRRGICPEGWHIPSVSEWGTLRVYTGYLRGNQENGYRCGIHDDGGAKALASTDDWLDYTDSDFPCAVGYHKEDNNSSGFSALPVGQCDDLSTGYNYIGTFRLIREHTSFWYLIEKNVTVNYYWLANDRGGFYAGGGMRLNELHPVRCLKDN